MEPERSKKTKYHEEEKIFYHRGHKERREEGKSGETGAFAEDPFGGEEDEED
jgi:hypothetical protein